MNTYITYLFCFFSVCVVAQVPFALRSQVEPNGVQKIKELDNGCIVTITKVKGNQNSKSTYKVSYLDTTLTPVWSTKMWMKKTENINGWEVQEKQVTIFSTYYNLSDFQSQLIIRSYDLKTGQFFKKEVLINRKVEPWFDATGKGRLYQTFHNAIASVSPSNYLTPLEYQNNVCFSPDQKLILSYYYVYSAKDLYAMAKIYNQDYEVIADGKVPHDINFTTYPMQLNNRGDVILKKVTSSGKVGLIQYNLKTRQDNYISLTASNSLRDNLTIHMLNNDEGVLATLNKKNGRFTGVTCTKFSFLKKEVTERAFLLFDVEFQNKIRRAQKEQGLSQDHYLYNFKLLDLKVDENQNIFITTEQQRLIGENFTYEDNIHEQIDKWAYFRARVHNATAIVWAIDSNLKLKWRYFVAKDQSTGVIDGVNTISILTHHAQKETHIAYSLSPKQINFNELHYITIDNETGQETSNTIINNPLKLSFARVYSFWTRENKFVWVGKKGLVGKKTFIQKYHR